MAECCPAMQEIMDKFDGAFYRPVYVEYGEGNKMELRADKLAVKLYKLTKAGNMSKAGSSSLFINFCPICGTDLRLTDTSVVREGDEPDA